MTCVTLPPPPPQTAETRLLTQNMMQDLKKKIKDKLQLLKKTWKSRSVL